MRPLSYLLTFLGSVVPAVLLGVILMVVSADVFMRLVLRDSLHIAHDLAIVALAGVVWFGIVGTARERELFGIKVLTDRLPHRWRIAVGVAVDLLVILIAAQVLRAAVIQVETARFTRFVALGWPKWIVSAGLAAAMAALIVVQLLHLWRLFRGSKND
ncbi:hypothetical protein OG2516_17565 [Oceanicola granulosus HTCC2516]|uniref:TRAP transporter small permease protein n=1 Tax=Oceanicola granulosus (strain ATCC BAA-861 / DSM 15982 / KCTC 12143 / HTCC2516) TaxID=314256 RepID=Q2CF67_OCEGH|nr:TRAP transporter small permease subunit [Oceanicola granulosus]EAR51260.1 hypothetical protein OG2516_17565 [Oceanicola granulosus HTCC2516]